MFLVLPVERAVKSDDYRVLTMKYASYQLPIGTVKWVYVRTEAKPQGLPTSAEVSEDFAAAVFG